MWYTVGWMSQGLERADAADAQHDLLLEAQFDVAAVQIVGDVLILLAVDLDVGVQQVQLDAAYVGAPDLGVNVAPGIGDSNQDGVALLISLQGERQVVKVIDRVALLLPAIRVQILVKVAFLVEQAHADQWYAQVAGGFQVVAGQNAQSAGIDLQRFGEAKLHRKVGDQRIIARFLILARVPRRAAHIVVQTLLRPPQLADKTIVGCQLYQAFLSHSPQHHDRVVQVSPPTDPDPYG